jgi:protein PhnA
MNIEQQLRERAGSVCELCGDENNLQVYEVLPVIPGTDNHVQVCGTCLEQIQNPEKIDPNHWRCLNTSMWSTIPAVQVLAWRLLHQLRNEGWPQDLLDQLYLEDDMLAWAKSATAEEDTTSDVVIHKDSNGTVLQAGDTVVLIKDLDVKGGGFTAKRGTAVRGITLVESNPEHIEGKVNGQQIVILTKYVKKSA